MTGHRDLVTDRQRRQDRQGLTLAALELRRGVRKQLGDDPRGAGDAAMDTAAADTAALRITATGADQTGLGHRPKSIDQPLELDHELLALGCVRPCCVRVHGTIVLARSKRNATGWMILEAR